MSSITPSTSDFDLQSSSTNHQTGYTSTAKAHRPKRQNLSLTSNPSQQLPAKVSASVPKESPNASHTTDFPQLSAHESFEGENALPDNLFDEYLTPEYSSENPYSERTTPQEYIWEQQFLHADSPQTDAFGIISDQDLFGSSQVIKSESEFDTILPLAGQQFDRASQAGHLLSPRLTTTPSPPQQLAGSTSRISIKPTPPEIPNEGRITQERPNSNHDMGAYQQNLSPNPQLDSHGQTSPIQRPVSPVVIVSSVQRGDSPGPASLPRKRSSSKRHRTEDSEIKDEIKATESLSPNSRLSAEYFDQDKQHFSRTGLGPSQRGTEEVATANQLADQRQLDERNAEVENWLATSETGSAAGDDTESYTSRRNRIRRDRIRAHSTGTRIDGLGIPVFSDRHIPGPGILIDQDTDEEYSENEFSEGEQESSRSPSPPVEIEKLEQPTEFPTYDDEIPPEQQEPLPRQFYRRTPWQDPLRAVNVGDTKDQPPTSNAAVMKWNQEAAKWDSASRAATWGTHRRLSEAEINSIVDGSRVRHLSLAKRGRERGSSILNKLIPRRSNSNIKKATDSLDPQTIPETDVPPPQQEGTGPITQLQRKLSSNKPKSPRLDTGSAFMAMTSHLTAVGSGNSVNVEPDRPKNSLGVLRKYRSKSDAGRSPNKSSPGIAELMTKHGGPPMPLLASPMQERNPILSPGGMNAPADDEDDEMADEVGIKMDLKIRADNIIPTFEGFKTHTRQLNPRLEPYLIDRIGQEQLRRYKKLVENKVKHTKAVRVNQKCASGKHCFELGDGATLISPRGVGKASDTTYAQFQISNPVDGEIDESSFSEGAVTPALFPVGIPLPPVRRLPAEFECPLCFKVKKFLKPSDWTKHVHEDLQPFSCTFPNCTEPKSFKRKADWVRHENERHRRLEYWKCNVQECNHLCYRKDNFLQHLVREHKKTEPKGKKGSGSSRNPAHDQAESEVMRLVDVCRYETDCKPRDEPCRFCGNVCSSWKKLSVHLGKHMEQIAMPVLELVKMREVSPDTTISPIEQNYQAQASLVAATSTPLSAREASNFSPYAMSATTAAYSGSSAGQSPATLHSAGPAMGPMSYDNHAYYSPLGISQAAQPPMYNSIAAVSGYGANAGMSMQHQHQQQPYLTMGQGYDAIYTPASNLTTSNGLESTGMPRSQPMENEFQGMGINAYNMTEYGDVQHRGSGSGSEQMSSPQHLRVPSGMGNEYYYHTNGMGHDGNGYHYS